MKSRQKSPTNKCKKIMYDGNYDASCMLISRPVSDKNSSSVFYIAQGVHKKCTQMCRQWWIVELHGCSCSWNHNTWTAWTCFLSCYLPNYKRCNSETWLTQSLRCKFSFSFLFHSNYITWLWKWNTLKHGKYVVNTCVLSFCIWVHFV